MPGTDAAVKPSDRSLLFRGRNLNRYRVYILATGIFLATCVLIPGFLSGPSIRALLVLTSILGIASVGQTVVAIIGGIDLSIAATISLSNVLLAVLTGYGWNFPAVASVV